MTTLDTIDIEPAGAASASVIWMHGLGADAHDFEPIVPELRLPRGHGVRFVFPNAPLRPVTVNGGMLMRAWYDVLSVDLPRAEDKEGIREAARHVELLIERETGRGVEPQRVLLAGFSQGGAVALYTGLRHRQSLAGIMALSSYIPRARKLADERDPANAGIPIFVAHGTYDGVIPLQYGRAGFEQLQGLGYAPEWHAYNMAHEVCVDELHDVSVWLKRVLSLE